MDDTRQEPVAVNYFLEPGYVYLASQPTVISGVLGSCVAVCLYDRKRRVGGMNHFRFPFTRDKRQATSYQAHSEGKTLFFEETLPLGFDRSARVWYIKDLDFDIQYVGCYIIQHNCPKTYRSYTVCLAVHGFLKISIH